MQRQKVERAVVVWDRGWERAVTNKEYERTFWYRGIVHDLGCHSSYYTRDHICPNSSKLYLKCVHLVVGLCSNKVDVKLKSETKEKERPRVRTRTITGEFEKHPSLFMVIPESDPFSTPETFLWTTLARTNPYEYLHSPMESRAQFHLQKCLFLPSEVFLRFSQVPVCLVPSGVGKNSLSDNDRDNNANRSHLLNICRGQPLCQAIHLHFCM